MGHFYAADGQPRHKVKMPDGERDSTITDARNNGWLLSYSTVSDIVKKPGLENAKQRRIYDYTRQFHDLDNYDAVRDAAFEDWNKAQEFGSHIHNYIENTIKGGPADQQFAVYADPMIAWLREAFGTSGALCEYTFGERELGVGGTMDFLIPGVVLVDWKTQNWKGKSSPTFYEDWAMQLGVYNDASCLGGYGPFVEGCWSVCLSTDQPGLFKTKQWTADKIEKGCAKFSHLLNYYCIEKNYDPRGWQND